MSIFFYILFTILLISILSYCLYTYKPQVKFKTHTLNIQLTQKNVTKHKEIYRSKTDLSDFMFISNNEFALIDNHNVYLFRDEKMIQSIHFESTFDLNVLCTNSNMLVMYTPYMRKIIIYKYNRNNQWYEYQSIVDPTGDNNSGFGFSMNYSYNKLYVATKTNYVYVFIESPSTNQFYLHSSSKVSDNITEVLNDNLFISASNYFKSMKLDSQVKYLHELESSGDILIGTLFKLYIFKNKKKDDTIQILEFDENVNRYILLAHKNQLQVLFTHSWLEVSLDTLSCIEYTVDNDLIVCGDKYCTTKDDVLHSIELDKYI